SPSRRHVQPAGPPLAAASARASRSARTGCARQYESTARRGMAGMKERASAWGMTGVGKIARSAPLSRARDFRVISARHSDMVHPRGGADAPGRKLPGRGKIFSNGAASSISPPIRALFVWVDGELDELPKSAPDSMLVHFLSENRFPLFRKMPRHR